MQINDYKQISEIWKKKKNATDHWKYSHEKIHLQMRQISALNIPLGVDMPFSNQT